MLRFIASLAFGVQGTGYGFMAVRQFLIFDGILMGLAIATAIFWSLGALFGLASAFLLFRSRGRRALRGGRWAMAVILLTCASVCLLGLGFAAFGYFFSFDGIDVSQRAVRVFRIFFFCLSFQSLSVSILGAAAAFLPYRRANDDAASNTGALAA